MPANSKHIGAVGSGPSARVGRNERSRRTRRALDLNEPVSISSPDNDESRRLADAITDIARTMAACEGVDDFASTGSLPERFFALLTNLYDGYDAFIAHQLEAGQLTVPCRLGCTRCCHQAIHGVYSFEIINLYRRLRPLDDFSAIHAALADFAARFQESVDDASEGEDGDGADPVMRTLDAFAAAAQPCPLLAGNNCRVYADRPAACRMYFSLTDPVYCTSAQGRNFRIELPREAQEILWALSDRLVYPFSTFLAQGLVSFAARRQLSPWSAS